MSNPRQLAFQALRKVQRGAYADAVVDQLLSLAQKPSPQGQAPLTERDRRLFTELVYGCVRQQRLLDGVIDRFAKKPAQAQPEEVRLLLHVGLYQLLFLDQIPASAAVDTTVELVKQNGLGGLAGFVNGLLRQVGRSAESPDESLHESLHESVDASPHESVDRLTRLQQLLGLAPEAEAMGLLYSFPDWVIDVWQQQFGRSQTEQLCQWMNLPPQIDLRVNLQKTSVVEVQRSMQAAGVAVDRIPHLPAGLRLAHRMGSVAALPGFAAGNWIVQDASAQLVSYLVDPQPGETIADACAAPGGKTVHLAELMGDRGTLYAIDPTPSRLKKLQQNVERLGLHSIHLRTGDSRTIEDLREQCDRVLVDAPCSGLGTLNRHADGRWRQSPESVRQLAQLQRQILWQAATWVKSGGILVYSTCTLHPLENEETIVDFLQHHPTWSIDPPTAASVIAPFLSVAEPTIDRWGDTENGRDRFSAGEVNRGSTAGGWVKIEPHRDKMDGFFMVRLKKG
jgi:16S rRNA (cytosine967-C5)-methyltransferase